MLAASFLLIHSMIATVNFLGPCVVKFAQWASSRHDLFDEDFCHRLAVIRDATKTHKWSKTEEALKVAFGEEWEKRLKMDPVPIGSGCVAQVYRGELIEEGRKKTREVAVKVIHPHVKVRTERAGKSIHHYTCLAISTCSCFSHDTSTGNL